MRFLPGHDQWVMGPGTQDPHVTPPSQRPAVTRKANPVFVGGVVRGTWSVTGDRLSVDGIDPATIEVERDRLATLLGRELRSD